MKKNYIFYALIASAFGLNLKYFPPYIYIGVAVIISLGLWYGVVWSIKNKKLSLVPALISFNFIGLSAAALKAIEVYLPQYQNYSGVLGWIMDIAFILGFVFLFIVGFRLGDRKVKINIFIAITTFAIFAFLYWFTTR